MILERAHALAAWVATIALVATPLVKKRDGRIAAAWAGFASLVAASLTGAWLEPSYRERIRQPLFSSSPALGWAFERKEHLAFAATLLAGSAVLSLLLARRHEHDPLAKHLGSSARMAWAASIVFALGATAVSTVVARRAPFVQASSPRVDTLPRAARVVHDAGDALP